MKFTFRVTILTILLTLILFTVAGLGWNSHRNATLTAQDLSRQIIEQTSLRIDNQINDFLLPAWHQCALNRLLAKSKQWSTQDFSNIGPYWVKVLETHPKLTRLTIGFEASGEWINVRRLPDGKLAIGELLTNASTGKLDLRSYWPQDYHKKIPFFLSANEEKEDPRLQHWYIDAKKTGRQTWSDTYVFYGVAGVQDAPGISCVTPIYLEDESLLGVMAASFDLYEICQYLKDLSLSPHGFAFVVEYRDDGEKRVIAHPDPTILLRVREKGNERQGDLIPTEELDDPRLRAFLPYLPSAHPSSHMGIVNKRIQAEGVEYFASYSCLTTKETPDWLICTMVPTADVLAGVYALNRQTIFIGLGVFVAAVLISLFVSARVAYRLEQIAAETKAIGQLQLEPSPVVHSFVKEVDELGGAVEEMKISLRSFQKYVPADLVRSLLASRKEAGLGGERRTISIFFSDIVEFTSLAEGLPAEQLVDHLRDYLSLVSEEIQASGGTVDKYIGDAVMAFWGAPAANPHHALAACTAALRCQSRLKEMRHKWQAEGKPLFWTRIGVNTGEVVVGNIGSQARLNYTVIGDPVNLASRLEGLNKHYGTGILISETTHQQTMGGIVARPVDWVSVKGKTEAVLVFELLGLKGETDSLWEEVGELSGQALARYRRQDWADAIHLFERILRLNPGDPVTLTMLARCHHYQDQPPGENWDGVHHVARGEPG